jgi:hypothetical protein
VTRRAPGLLLAVLLAGCDGQRLAVVYDLGSSDLTPAQTCPNDQPDTCPSPAPSYQAQVGTLIQTYCAPCHSPSGVAFDHLLDNYDEVNSIHGSVLDQVNACNMPPADGGLPLPEADRKIIVEWVACGANQ